MPEQNDVYYLFDKIMFLFFSWNDVYNMILLMAGHYQNYV